MDDDTAIGGPAAYFPPTRVSMLEGARSGDPDERRAAFESLVSGYWKPVYKHVRLRWRRSNEDAKDLTQGFLTAVIEKGFLDGYDSSKARLRTYLRSCLDRFVQNRDRDARRLKRGGGAIPMSLDFGAAEGELVLAAATSSESIEEAFEREWVRSLFALAVERLESDCGARRRPEDFRLFERYDLVEEGAERPTYAELGRALGLPETTVTNRLAAVRRRFRGIVLETLRELTGSEEEFRDEARALLGRESV